MFALIVPYIGRNITKVINKIYFKL